MGLSREAQAQCPCASRASRSPRPQTHTLHHLPVTCSHPHTTPLQVPTQPHTSNSHKSHMTSDTLTHIHTHSHRFTHSHTHSHTQILALTQVHLLTPSQARSHSHSYLLTFTQTHSHINSHTPNHTLKFSYTVTRPHTSSHILTHIPIHTLTPQILTHTFLYTHTHSHTHTLTQSHPHSPLMSTSHTHTHTHTHTHARLYGSCLSPGHQPNAGRDVYLFIFCLHWSFVAANSLPPVVESRGYSLLRCAGFSSQLFLLLRGTGSRQAGFSSCGAPA